MTTPRLKTAGRTKASALFFCMKSTIYIDGFNLYYGLVKGTHWKWLDIQKYFTMLRKYDDILVIKYFTAECNGSPDQKTYLSALDTLPLVKIILGKFKDTTILCKVDRCKYRGDRLFTKSEEKRTDVNIAIHMLNDACTNTCDRLILVSGDSDLTPALDMIKENVPRKELFVSIPAPNKRHKRAAATQLRSSAHKSKTLFPTRLLDVCQFPDVVIDATGDPIKKPSTW